MVQFRSAGLDYRIQANVFFNGEFDSGSERTLAAWIRHASRTGILCSNVKDFSGVRVLNTWAICREVGDNLLKGELIPDVKIGRHLLIFKAGDRKAWRFMMSPRPIS